MVFKELAQLCAAVFASNVACYSPLHGYVGEVNEKGSRPIAWKAPAGSVRQVVPCGKCVGCKLQYAKNWAIRCIHESQMHERNSFITLTFDDDHLPADGSLDYGYFQDFMKRLRLSVDHPIRFFHAGEYGGKLQRPHHHALLFGHDFDDKIVKTVRNGNKFYESPSLGALWPMGFHSIGDVNYATASYVARYCVKKVNGEAADEHYVNRKTGVLLKPEFTTMSRRPGIGATWFKKFKSDVFPSDEVVMSGRPCRPPRYYDNLLDKEDPDLLESLKLKRAAKVSYSESTDERLRVKEEVKIAEVSKLKRTLEVNQ